MADEIPADIVTDARAIISDAREFSKRCDDLADRLAALKVSFTTYALIALWVVSLRNLSRAMRESDAFGVFRL